MDLSEFNAVLSQLDADIADTEARLADLQLKRKGAEAFLSYFDRARPTATERTIGGVTETVTIIPRSFKPASGQDAPTDASPADFVRALVDAMTPGQQISVDDVVRASEMTGYTFSREQLRNAIHYVVRRGELIAVKRGAWTPSDAEGPAATGPSDDNPTPDEEGGGSHETNDSHSSSTAEDQHHPQLGASIAEVAS